MLKMTSSNINTGTVGAIGQNLLEKLSLWRPCETKIHFASIPQEQLSL